MAGYVWKGKPEEDAPKKPATQRITTSICGTHSGYQAHLYYRQEACRPCKEAQAAYHREYRQRAKRGEITPRAQLVDNCGTNAGYMRHIRRGVDACQPCRTAHSKYTSGHKRRQRAERKAATIRREELITDGR